MGERRGRGRTEAEGPSADAGNANAVRENGRGNGMSDFLIGLLGKSYSLPIKY